MPSHVPLRGPFRTSKTVSQILDHRTRALAVASSSIPARAQPLSQQQPQTQLPAPASRQYFSHQPPNMSTMPASHGHSQACCNIPPVVSQGYQPKGSYEQIGGFNTYVTGPADATKGIVVIMDIFGFFDQTIQGADILAYSDEKQKYRVYIPDWFQGKPCPISIYPPDTEEKKKQLGEFFTTNPPTKAAGLIPDYVKSVKAKDTSVSKMGILGFCWGGKVAALSIKADTNPFAVAASAHPAMVDPADAKDIHVPFAMLASGDEPADDVKNFEAALPGPKHVEIFGDQIHGWMAARSDLSNPRVKQEYERGYKTVLSFFGENF